MPPVTRVGDVVVTGHVRVEGDEGTCGITIHGDEVACHHDITEANAVLMDRLARLEKFAHEVAPGVAEHAEIPEPS